MVVREGTQGQDATTNHGCVASRAKGGERHTGAISQSNTHTLLTTPSPPNGPAHHALHSPTPLLHSLHTQRDKALGKAGEQNLVGDLLADLACQTLPLPSPWFSKGLFGEFPCTLSVQLSGKLCAHVV